jgi:hypothetical protein
VRHVVSHGKQFGEFKKYPITQDDEHVPKIEFKYGYALVDKQVVQFVFKFQLQFWQDISHLLHKLAFK